VIEEYQVNGDVKTTYTHGWDLISQDNGNNRIYYQVDGLGSARQLKDINGAVVVEYDYDAYGNLIRKVGDADNNYLFAGEQFDDAIDGYYLRARYYDSLTGRFVSTDPFEGYNNQPITLHDYLYAGVNPVNAIDPSGEVALVEYLAAIYVSTPANQASFSVIGAFMGFGTTTVVFIGYFLSELEPNIDFENAIQDAIENTENDEGLKSLRSDNPGLGNNLTDYYQLGFTLGYYIALLRLEEFLAKGIF